MTNHYYFRKPGSEEIQEILAASPTEAFGEYAQNLLRGADENIRRKMVNGLTVECLKDAVLWEKWAIFTDLQRFVFKKMTADDEIGSY